MMGVLSMWPLETFKSPWVGSNCFSNANNGNPSRIIVSDLNAHPPTQEHRIIKQPLHYLRKCIHTCCILYFFHFLFLLSSHFIPSGFSILLSFPLRSFFVVLIYFRDIHLPLFSTVFVFSSDFPYFLGGERRRYLSPTVRSGKTYNHKVEKEHGVRTEALIFHFLSVKVRECDLREDGWRARKGKEDNDRLNASFSTGALVYLLPKWPKMK